MIRLPRCLGISWVSIALIGAGCAPAPKQHDSGTLSEATTKIEVVRFLSKAPGICVPSRRGFELCSWRAIERDRAAWHQLAASIGTRDRLNLLCEFPDDRAPRAPGSCSLHPRRSKEFEASPEASAALGATPENAAAATLNAAGSLIEVSKLVGDAPDSCSATGPSASLCVWRVSNRCEGWGLLAAVVDTTEQVVLVCEFSRETGDRVPGSCDVSQRR